MRAKETAKPAPPRGRTRAFSDAQLREALADGLSPKQIAERYGVSRQSIYARTKRLQVTTLAAVSAPDESRRFVRRQINAMDELGDGLACAKKLLRACDGWLEDPNNPGEYDLGPRSGEVEITYEVEVPGRGDQPRIVKRKAKLSVLLGALEKAPDLLVDGERFLNHTKGEYKHADPRELVLKTAAEIRQIVGECANLARMLADAQMMERFREAVLTEIARESPDVAARIAEAIQRSLVVHSAFRGPESLPE